MNENGQDFAKPIIVGVGIDKFHPLKLPERGQVSCLIVESTVGMLPGMEADGITVDTEVTRALDKAGVAFEVRQHAQPALTCETVAAERGVRVSQIVKCMVGRAADGGLFAMLLPGDKLLKIKKARKHVGMGIDLVPPGELAADLGLIVGAISPVQLIKPARILMDPTVLDEDYVDVSSGDPLAGVELSSADLRDLLKAELVEIVSTGSQE